MANISKILYPTILILVYMLGCYIGELSGISYFKRVAVYSGHAVWLTDNQKEPIFKWNEHPLIRLVITEKDDNIYETIIYDNDIELGKLVSNGNILNSEWMVGFRIGCISAGVNPEDINIEVIKKEKPVPVPGKKKYDVI